MLFGVIWVFTLARGEKGMLAYVGFDDVPAKAPRGPWVRSTFVRNGIALTVAVLAAGVLGHLAASRPTVIPDRQNFGTLPLEFPEWKTRDTALSAEVQTVLGADDYILTDMFGPNEEIMNLYIAYLDARRDGKSWHSPMQCLPGGGWEVAEESVRETTRADGRPYKHKRMIIQQGEDRRLVYYWYDQRGRKMASEFSMRASVMWDDLTQRRSDGAMVRLMTPILPGESIEAAEARVEESARAAGTHSAQICAELSRAQLSRRLSQRAGLARLSVQQNVTQIFVDHVIGRQDAVALMGFPSGVCQCPHRLRSL